MRATASQADRDPPRLGMVTMRERAQAIGGTFQVLPLAGSGTQLTVRVPLSP
jgi:signal transduction histidine kinase